MERPKIEVKIELLLVAPCCNHKVVFSSCLLFICRSDKTHAFSGGFTQCLVLILSQHCPTHEVEENEGPVG